MASSLLRHLRRHIFRGESVVSHPHEICLRAFEKNRHLRPMNLPLTECRRVTHALRAWKAGLSDVAELIPLGPVAPIGEPVLIQPFEEVEVLRRTSVSKEIMVLVSWRDTLYLVNKDDLDERTMRVFRSGR